MIHDYEIYLISPFFRRTQQDLAGTDYRPGIKASFPWQLPPSLSPTFYSCFVSTLNIAEFPFLSQNIFSALLTPSKKQNKRGFNDNSNVDEDNTVSNYKYHMYIKMCTFHVGLI